MHPASPAAVFAYSTNNLGDEVQTLAALAFHAGPPRFLNRDWVTSSRMPRGTRLIANGWYNWLHYGMVLPRNVTPLYVAVHIRHNQVTPQVRAHLLRFGPIGCRDQHTLAVLQRADVPAYFSGCLTLTLQRPDVPREGHVLLHDVDPTLAPLVPHALRDGARTSTQVTDDVFWDLSWGGGMRGRARRALNQAATAPQVWKRLAGRGVYGALGRVPFVHNTQHALHRLDDARALLRTFAAARVVVTSRLHCALPCLAMGTPVVMVHPHVDDTRFGGLSELIGIRTPRAGDNDAWAPVTRDVSPWANVLRRMCTHFMRHGTHPFLDASSGVTLAELQDAQARVLA